MGIRTSALALASALLFAGPASAVTLCIVPCDGTLPPPPDVIVSPPPLVLPLPPMLTLLVAPGEDFDLSWGGDVRVEIPFGGVQVSSLDFEAAGSIAVESGISIESQGPIAFCSLGSCSTLPGELPGSTPIAVRLSGTAGHLRLVSLGDIALVPVPEPSPAVLIGLGLAILGGARTRHLPLR